MLSTSNSTQPPPTIITTLFPHTHTSAPPDIFIHTVTHIYIHSQYMHLLTHSQSVHISMFTRQVLTTISCIYLSEHTCTHPHTFYKYTHTCSYAYSFAMIYTYIQWCVYALMYPPAHSHPNTYAYVYIYTHKYTYTHICKCTYILHSYVHANTPTSELIEKHTFLHA